jgi:hypothetical protein
VRDFRKFSANLSGFLLNKRITEKIGGVPSFSAKGGQGGGVLILIHHPLCSVPLVILKIFKKESVLGILDHPVLCPFTSLFTGLVLVYFGLVAGCARAAPDAIYTWINKISRLSLWSARLKRSMFGVAMLFEMLAQNPMIDAMSRQLALRYRHIQPENKHLNIC